MESSRKTFASKLILKANIYIYLFVITAVLILPFLGTFHLFDWDEVNFAECAREMIQTGDYTQVMINFVPFWEKPPLFIWMQAISMKAFGISEFAARLPNVFAAFFTFLFLFQAGKELKNVKLGWIWVIAYAGSLLPNIYFHSGIIDPWFNLFIVTGLYFGFKGLKGGQLKYYLISGILIGLSILTKGPVGLILFSVPLVIFILFNRKEVLPKWSGILSFIVSFLLIGGLWFFFLLLEGKEQVIYDFMNYQVRLFQTKDAGHGGPFYYHFLVLLIGCFPASFIAIRRFSFRPKYSFEFLMALTLLFTLLLFSIVQTKIIHYSSLCYFPITFLAALHICEKIENKSSLKASAKTILIGLFVLGVIFTLVGWALNHPEFILKNFKTDSFTRDSLGQDLSNSLLFYLPGIFVLLAVLLLYFNYLKEQCALVLLGGSLTVAVGILTLIPLVQRIENYSQRGHVALCESARRQHYNVLIHPIGFKSFVPLFYGLQSGTIMKNELEAMDEFNLVNSRGLNKPVLFTSKAYKKKEILALYPKLICIEEQGGFCLYGKKDNVLLK